MILFLFTSRFYFLNVYPQIVEIFVGQSWHSCHLPQGAVQAVGLVNLVWLDIHLNFYQSFLSALVCQISVLSLTFTPIKCSKHNTFYIKKYSRARLPVELEGLRGLTLLICSDFSHAGATRAKTTIIQANRKNDIDWFFFLCPQFERMDLT